MDASHKITEFYEVFTKRRHEIGKLLSTLKHDDIVNIFVEIYKEYRDGEYNNPVTSMLLGKNDFCDNRRMATYAIPTIEFLHVIFAVQNILDKHGTVEFYAGMGLFSHMYRAYCDNRCELYMVDQVFAADGNYCVETSSANTYYEVSKKTFEQSIHRSIPFGEYICMAILPSPTIAQTLPMFLDACRPACMILVLEERDLRMIDNLRTQHGMIRLPNVQYNVLILDAKIITYNDYFTEHKKKHHAKTVILSMIEITKETIDSFVHGVLGIDCVLEYTHTETQPASDDLFTSCVMRDMFPKWMLGLPETAKNEIMNSLYAKLLLSHPALESMIFKFIKNNISDMNEYREYLSWRPSMPIYCSQKRFAEYKTFYRMLANSQSVNELQKIGVIPTSIDTVDLAFAYLFEIYEMTSKH